MTITQLPFSKYTKGSLKPKDYTLLDDLYLEHLKVPAGTTVKLITGRDFGFVVLPAGFSRRIFKY